MTRSVRRQMMNGFKRFVAGFLAAASVIPIGLGGLRLYANICRPEESPEWTAHMIKQSAIMTALGVAVLAVCGRWYLRLLSERLRAGRTHEDETANNTPEDIRR